MAYRGAGGGGRSPAPLNTFAWATPSGQGQQRTDDGRSGSGRGSGGGGRGGGRGAGACFTCGQTGHLQRDCPQNARPPSGAGAKARPPPPADLRETVAVDLREEWPSWPFTAYSPVRERCSLVEGDASFEELRASWRCSQHLPALARQAAEGALRDAAQERVILKTQLASASNAQLSSWVAEAAQGRAHKASLPPLLEAPIALQTPTSAQAPVALSNQPQSQLAQPPMPTPTPLQSLLPPPAVRPQPLRPPQPLPAVDVETAWRAAAFSLGGVPEEPPPPAHV